MDSIQLKLPFPPEIEWRDIPGYEGIYQVSNTGLVRRIKPARGGSVGKILVGGASEKGYRYHVLCANDKHKHWRVHQLVMLTFVGERPAGMEINHKNGIKTDNRPENLEYITHQENIRHIIKLKGWALQGIKHPLAKLNDDKVREIRRLHKEGYATVRLGAMFGVTPNAIGGVVNRRTWKHVD